MYRAGDRVENAVWLDELETAADELGMSSEARSCAIDLFLSVLPEADRSKPAGIATSLYVGALITGEKQTQTAVADAVGVSRLVVQRRWKSVLEAAGFDPPRW